MPGKVDESPLLDVLTPEVPGHRAAMPKQGDPLTQAEVNLIQALDPRGGDLARGAGASREAQGRRELVVAAAARRPGPARSRGPPGGLGASSDRPIPRCRARREGTVARPRSRAPHPHPTARVRPHRAAADARGDPGLRGRSAPDAYERLVDRLLASPRYGEHWGRHWLDVVRFGESTGYERNVILDNAWPFRDYVIRRFNDDKPFDRLVVEHLAGDVVGPGDPASRSVRRSSSAARTTTSATRIPPRRRRSGPTPSTTWSARPARRSWG